MFKRNIPLIISLLLCVASLPFFFLQREKEPLTELQLVTIANSPLYAPLYLAESQGFFAEERLNITISTINSNDKLFLSLAEGEADIILAGPQGTLIRSRDGKGDFINFAQLIKKDTSYLMARNPQPAFKWRDLENKIIIGGVTNSTPQLMLEHLLSKNGLQPYRKVDIIHNIPPEGVKGAFEAGVGDYIHLLEPQVSLLEKEKIAYVVAPLGDYLGEISYTNFITTTTVLKEKPQVIQRFVNSLYKGQLWCKYHSTEEIYQALLPFFPQLDNDLLYKILDRYKLHNVWTEDPLIREKDFKMIQNIFLQRGLFAEQINFSRIVDNTWAKKAVEEIPLPKKYRSKD